MKKIGKKRTKGQGLSLNVIIVAILCLIVLFVVLAIFTGKISIFGKDLQSCGGRGGECKKICQANEAQIEDTNCDKLDQYCCVKILKE